MGLIGVTGDVVMSLECSECERDLRGGHGHDCSRHPVNIVDSLLSKHVAARKANDLNEAVNTHEKILQIVRVLYET